MKDDAQGMAVAGAQSADAMPEVDTISASGALHRAVMNREGNGVTLPKRNHFWPRLHPRTLFGEHEFPSRKILAWIGQQDRHLDRENVLAVEILMQTIVVAFGVLEEQGGWLQLAGVMASP